MFMKSRIPRTWEKAQKSLNHMLSYGIPFKFNDTFIIWMTIVELGFKCIFQMTSLKGQTA